jgi:hypothetical protein
MIFFQIKVVEKIKTQILRLTTSFRILCSLCANVGKYGTSDGPQVSVQSGDAHCMWIAKDTDTHLEYAIFIVFQWQQWLFERAYMLYV